MRFFACSSWKDEMRIVGVGKTDREKEWMMLDLPGWLSKISSPSVQSLCSKCSSVEPSCLNREQESSCPHCPSTAPSEHPSSEACWDDSTLFLNDIKM